MKKERTRKWANYPTLFSEDRQPDSDFLVIPKVSSERRKYIPIAYLSKDIIINNTVSALVNATLYYFGIITSIMHMAWLKNTCGRMKSDYILLSSEIIQISKKNIKYNQMRAIIK